MAARDTASYFRHSSDKWRPPVPSLGLSEQRVGSGTVSCCGQALWERQCGPGCPRGPGWKAPGPQDAQHSHRPRVQKQAGSQSRGLPAWALVLGSDEKSPCPHGAQGRQGRAGPVVVAGGDQEPRHGFQHDSHAAGLTVRMFRVLSAAGSQAEPQERCPIGGVPRALPRPSRSAVPPPPGPERRRMDSKIRRGLSVMFSFLHVTVWGEQKSGSGERGKGTKEESRRKERVMDSEGGVGGP